MEKVIRNTQEKWEVELVGTDTLLAFADDLVILGTSINEIKNKRRKTI